MSYLKNIDDAEIKKVEILEKIIRQKAQDIIGDIAEKWYSKGHDIVADTIITKVATSNMEFMFDINYITKTITMTKYPPNSEYQDEIAQRLQIALLYKPILEKIQEIVDTTPDRYDMSYEDIEKLKQITIIPYESIEHRIATNIKIDYLQTIIQILEEDFKEIEADYAVEIITNHLDEHIKF